MQEKKVLKYIQKNSNNGFSENEIREKLEKEDYSKESIENAFSEFHKKRRIRKNLIFLACAILIIGILIILIRNPDLEQDYGEINQLGMEIAKKAAEFRKNEFLTYNESAHYAVVAMSSDAAVKKNNTCSQLNGTLAREKCNGRYEKWTEYYLAAKGNCSYLNLTEEGCRIFKEGVKECPAYLETKDLLLCQSFINKDVSACKEIYTNKKEENGCSEKLSFLLAINNNNASLCENVPFILARETCRRIVLKNSTMFDDIILDIALVEKSRNINDFSLCQAVKIKEIRSMCFDKKLSYREIVDKVNFRD